MNGDREPVVAMTAIVAAFLLLVTVAVLAIAMLLDPVP